MRRRSFAILSVAAGLMLGTAANDVARADAIDGDWCRADGKRMTIRGPDIVTPGGNQIKGDYTRHFFSYIIPAGEPDAGGTVSITLLNEYLAHARQGGADAPVQEWRRCPPGVS